MITTKKNVTHIRIVTNNRKEQIMKTILSKPYLNFCRLETSAINAVGFTTLTFQEQLRENCDIPQLYEFWLNKPIPETEGEVVLSFMMAGWIGVAGILQAAINFDNNVPAKTKLISLYTFGLCDWFWVLLIIQHFHVFSFYHVVGSLYIIWRRLEYMLNPEKCFIEQNKTSVTQ